jgi:hypothetical protein
MHVHVQGSSGELKFWLEPKIELAQHAGLPDHEVREVHRLVEEHADEICSAWKTHFS